MGLLTSDATHCALGGGSRSGKTFWLIRAIILRALLAPGSRHVIFRYRANAIQASVVEDTFPKVMKLCFDEGFYNVKNWTKSPNLFYEFANESQIWFAGLDDKDRVEKILGQEFVTEYFNECSQIPWASVVLAKSRLAQKVSVPAGKGSPAREMALKCYYDLNPPSKRHWTYTYLVEKKDPVNKQPVVNQASIGFQQMNPDGNVENLSVEYLDFLDTLPEAARKRFKLGQFAEDSDGALWTAELLDQNRRLATVANPLPQFVRVVIAVDPSGCSGPEDTRSDEVGITVNALGSDGHGYLLEDLSGKYGPTGWAKVVCDAYDRHKADRVVAEANYGGAMVESTIKVENPDIPVSMVTATRGKVIRAEPVSALYERGRIHHVGYHPELEDQLCDFSVVGYLGMNSPDRADASIWGFTELFPGLTMRAREDDGWRPNKVITRKRSANRYRRT